MGSAPIVPREPEVEFEFLCVDPFMKTLVDARALKSALELGLIDHLVDNGPGTLGRLETEVATDGRGLRLLLGFLAANQVIERTGDEVRLTQRFQTALRFRDLLEAKLDFANLVAPDFAGLFTTLLSDPGQFMRQARLFELFGYQRCFELTPDNLEKTRRWMRFTTCLTRYEAQACLRHHDFSRHARMLDIGGNSGEFVLQVCKQHPRIHGTVFDLPVVCQIGREHVARQPEGERITFIAGNALADPLPGGFDLICFKSMLHDWPEEHAVQFLARACRSLNPGGTLLIFERAPIEPGATTLPYSMIPMLLFFRSFRPHSFYVQHLEALGLGPVVTQTLPLELPFILVTATRAGGLATAVEGANAC